MQRLPEDIPHRDELIEAGFVNYAVLQNHRSFETMKGFSPDMAREVKDYIFGDDKSTNYTVAELKDMDLSDKDASFFEGDDRKSVQDLA